MTGAGTRTDPYIVSTWEEMESLLTSDAFIKFEDNCHINLVKLKSYNIVNQKFTGRDSTHLHNYFGFDTSVTGNSIRYHTQINFNNCVIDTIEVEGFDYDKADFESYDSQRLEGYVVNMRAVVYPFAIYSISNLTVNHIKLKTPYDLIGGVFQVFNVTCNDISAPSAPYRYKDVNWLYHYVLFTYPYAVRFVSCKIVINTENMGLKLPLQFTEHILYYFNDRYQILDYENDAQFTNCEIVYNCKYTWAVRYTPNEDKSIGTATEIGHQFYFFFPNMLNVAFRNCIISGDIYIDGNSLFCLGYNHAQGWIDAHRYPYYWGFASSRSDIYGDQCIINFHINDGSNVYNIDPYCSGKGPNDTGSIPVFYKISYLKFYHSIFVTNNGKTPFHDTPNYTTPVDIEDLEDPDSPNNPFNSENPPINIEPDNGERIDPDKLSPEEQEIIIPQINSPYIDNNKPFLKTVNHGIIIPTDVNRFGKIDIESNIPFGAFLYNNSLPDRIMYNEEEVQFVVLPKNNTDTAYFQSVYKTPPCVVSIPFNIIDNNDNEESNKNNYRYRKNRESTYSKFINNQWTNEPILKQVNTDGDSAVLNQEVHLSGSYYGNWESQRCVNYLTENYVDNELVVKNNNVAYIVSKNFLEDLSWTICIKAKANEYSDTSVLFNLLLLKNDSTTKAIYIHAKGEKYYSNINKEITEKEITCDFSQSHEFMIMCSNYNDYKYVTLFIDKEYIDIFDIGSYNEIVQCSIGLVRHDTFDSTNLKNFFGNIDYIDIYSSDLNRDYNKEYFEFVEITATEVDENRELTRASRKFESANELLEYMKESENTIYNLSIQTPDDVCFIDNHTFDKCSQINEVIFNDGPSELAKDCYDTGIGLFSNCTNLTKVTLPNTLININNAMFTKCSNLTYINIPDNVTNIGMYAFNECTSLNTIDNFENSLVETIGERAFYKSAISALTLPDTVAFIGESAFNSCSQLTDVTLCGYISDYAFFNCTALENIDLCENTEITHIGTSAFHATSFYNSASGTVYICNWLYKVKDIDDNGVLELKEDTVGIAVSARSDIKTTTTTTILPNNEVVYETTYSNVIKSVLFNDSLKYINSSAFSGTWIESITIPDSVIELGTAVFHNCSKLRTIILPASLTVIPASLCNGCTSLETIYPLTNITIIEERAFYNCNALREITLSDNVEYIGKYAFANCTTIKQLNLHDDIYVDYYFIKNCTSLESLYLPNTVNSIDNYDLDTLTGLKEISVSDLNKYYLAENNILYRKSGSYYVISRSYNISDKEVIVYVPRNYQETDIVLPLDTTMIHKFAFANCKNIEHITFNSSIVYIGESAFANCDNLIDVSIELAPLENNTSVTIPQRCFLNCSNLENINISQTSWDLVTYINDNAFDGCESLVLNNLPNSLKSVSNYAFRNCKNIQISSLPETLQRIDSGAFYGCENISISDTTNLTNIDSVGGYAFAFSGIASPILNQNITSIARYTYQGCNNITSVTIPPTITSIGEYAFADCHNIITVDINSNLSDMDVTAFANCNNLTGFTVVNTNTTFSAVDGVLFSTYDNTHRQLIQYPAGNTNTSYTLPTDIVRNDGQDLYMTETAFGNANNLKTIVFPESLTFIAGMFKNWTGVETLTIPKTVTRMNRSAFSNCTNLKTIYIHKNMTLIDRSVFTGCDNVTDIYLDFISTSTSSVKTNAPYGAINATVHYRDENITRVEFTGEPKLTYNQRETISIGNLSATLYYEDSEHNEYSMNVTNKLVANPAVGTVMNNTGEYTLTVTFTGLNGTDYVQTYTINVQEKNTITITQLDDNFEPTDNIEMFETIPTAVTYLKNNTSNRYNVSIPNSIGVTEFSNQQFKNCTSLYSITIPTDFSVIKSEMFYGCSNLNTVILPNTITTINSSAFYGCTNLTNINIPESVTVIESNAFKNCTNIISGTGACYKDNWLLSYSGATGEITITDGTIGLATEIFNNNKNITAINLPNSIKYINNKAFYNCTKITTINVPDLVTSIPTDCFYGCSLLATVTLPQNLEYIGNNAFRGCSKLTNISIPDNVSYIGTNAFYGCSTLTEITLPNNLESLEANVFYSCTNLTIINIGNGLNSNTNMPNGDKLQQINVSENNNYLSSADGILYNKHKTTLIKVPKATTLTTITIPDSVTTIADSAINSCTKPTAITIPDSVINIGTYAFYNSKATMTIPNTVESIGEYAFYGCINLTSYTSSNVISGLNGYTFCGCTNLLSVTITSNVLSIGQYCFSGCNKLTTLTINTGLTAIGDYAFSKCTVLNNVTIPNSVTTIGNYVFQQCAGLTNIVLSENISSMGNYVFSECSNLETISVPNNITNIIGMFNKCVKLRTVNIPNSVTAIGDYAFNNCSVLESINIPDNIVSIGSYAFAKCVILANINIAKPTLKTIGSYAFNNCYLMPNQDMGSLTIQTISTNAFNGCSSFTSISLPDTITTLSDYAFANCTNLITANIPININTIQASLFENCTNLTNITIPNNITTIKSSAFKNCKSFTAITIPDTVTSIASSIFSGCENMETCNIPTGIKTIPESLFMNCKKLIQITIPEVATTINKNAFNGCETITTITIPKNITAIATSVFSGCKALTTINVDSENTKYTVVDNVLFNNTITTLIAYPANNNVSEYTVPNTVTTIQEYSFAYSHNLEIVNIPSSVTSMSSYVFRYSEGITTININKTANSIRNSPWGATSATINWLG